MERIDVSKIHGTAKRYDAGNGVVHYAYYRSSGAWCNDEPRTARPRPVGIRHPVATPVTCVWCLSGFRWKW